MSIHYNAVSVISPQFPLLEIDYYRKKTRMHSSRMRTARALTVSPSMLCTGGCLLWGVPSLGVGGSAPGGKGVCSLGVPGLAGSGPGGVCSRRVVSQHALRQTPPMNRITHACENITLPKLRCGR